MANLIIDRPTRPVGDTKRDTAELYMYLCRMSEQLSQAMNQIVMEQAAEEQRTVQASGGGSSGGQYEGGRKSAEYETLKSLIIKNAEVIRHEMDEYTLHMDDEFEAISSQFGTLQQNLSGDIDATARGILQSYKYEERISTLETDGTVNTNYVTSMSGRIFSGILDESTGKVGIAIGENVTYKDQDGNVRLNHNNKMATFTMDRLSFYQGGVEVAYFSNNSFYIEKGIIRQSLQMGNHIWKVLAGGAIALTTV